MFGPVTVGAIYEGTAGLHAYRKACAETCAISSLDDPERFSVRCTIHHVDSAVLADLRSSSLRCLRSARHVARGAYDHYQITFDVSGRLHYRSGRQEVPVTPGDIIVVDSARETNADVRAPDQGLAHALALFVPRIALGPLARTPEGGHLRLVRSEDPLAGALWRGLSMLLQAIELESWAQAQAAAGNLIQRLAGSSWPGGGIDRALHHASSFSAADSLERLIERRLDSAALSLELLCSHSGCSRATVYRILEAQGGPMGYIRQRRLQRAFQELISGRVPYGQIRMLALRHRFASEATFNRAFRRAFGMPPGEVREIAARSRHATRAVGSRAGDAGREGTRPIDWLRTLGAYSAS